VWGLIMTIRRLAPFYATHAAVRCTL